MADDKGPGGSEDTEDSKVVRVKPTRPPTSGQWWRSEELGVDPHDIIGRVVTSIRENQSVRYESYKRFAQIYGANLVAFGMQQSMREVFEDRLTINELASTIDTLHAQIFKNRIVPLPQTTGGQWDQQQRAKDLGRWLDGTFDEAGFFDAVVPVAGLDCLVMGTGPIKVGSEIDGDEGKIVFERIPPWDCFVDETEGRYGKPRSFHQRMLVDRGVLIGQFGAEDDGYHGTAKERVEALENLAQTSSDHSVFEHDTHGDQILVTFSWHLPSYKGADDGKYAMVVKNTTLVYEPYKRNRFPFAFIRHGIPMGEFWGQSAVRRIAPAQRELDKGTERLQIAHDLIGIPRILVGKGSKVAVQHIDDIIGSIIECEDIGQIKEWTAQPIHPEFYNYLSIVRQSMGETLGVSKMSQNSQLPAGMQNASGVALERFEDVEQARQAMLHRSYEAAVVDLAELAMDEAQDLEDRGINVQARARGKGMIDVLNWKEVKLDRKQFVLKLPPASALPKTPAAKLQKLQELKADNAITETTFRRLSEIGDAEAQDDFDDSDEDIILKNLTHMVKTGEYITPIGVDDLELAKKLAGKYINWCRVHEVPADKQALIAQYLDEVIQAAKPPPQPMTPAGGAQVPGGPVVGGPPPPPMDMPPPPMPPGPPPGPPMAPGGLS